MFTIKSIRGAVHDTGSAPGCLPYKIVVTVEIPVKDFNKLCPVYKKAESTLCGRRAAKRDLGNLVVDVNNAVYAFNFNIRAYHPSIDSSGDRKAKNGIKTLEFVYFMGKDDWQKAEALGFEHFKFKGHAPQCKSFQSFNIKQIEEVAS